ncbi:MAG: replicative DNA helicase [Gemmatimonadetes bacterium]|nr:replicative DNA helicase [Gemmatimonadota bacterium]
MTSPVASLLESAGRGRQAPHSADAEISVLGAMLLDAAAIGRALELSLRSEDFYSHANRTLFASIVRLYEKAQVVDPVTIKEDLRRNGELDRIGGELYLTDVLSSVPTIANVHYHAQIVLDHSIRRRLIAVGTEVVADAYEKPDDADTLLDKAERSIFAIADRRLKAGFRHIGSFLHRTVELIEALQKNPDQVTGVPSGFDDLDRLTGGFQLSDLVIVAARPAVGKTSFALNVAQHASIKRDIPVAIFSLEMSTEQLVQRVICSEARIDARKMRIGRIGVAEWPRIVRACDRLQNAKIYIDDTPALSILEMRAKSRRLKSEIDLGLIVVDYLQLMEVGAGYSRADNRQQEITVISRSLKALAKELNTPVVALSQLSRAVEQRTGKPRLSDLRESGSIEQDADVVIFLYQEESDAPDSDKSKGLVEVMVAKHRNGPVGSVKLRFAKEFTRFENYSERTEF